MQPFAKIQRALRAKEDTLRSALYELEDEGAIERFQRERERFYRYRATR